MKYDRQDVIEKATNLFWKKGYHATSMRNLQEAIDMRPGSIYAGFGSKDGLFLETLQYYANQSQELISSARERASSPLGAVKLFFSDSINSCSTLPSGMCMLVKSIAELTDENADLLAEARRLMRGIEDTFAELLSEAIDCGELDSDSDPRRLAQFLQMQLMGLKTYAQARDGDIEADELIAVALSCLK